MIPLSLYIHIPWCIRKCPYCDFNSHQLRDPVPEKQYIAALLADLAEHKADIQDRPLKSIFLGGGTPSLFSPDAINELLAGVRKQCVFAEEIEITLEANPGTVEQARFAGFYNAGVNRLSIGVQSFQDEKLKALGRIHDADTAKNAIIAAKQAGFSNFNIDIMFGLPQQTVSEALDDLYQAMSLEPTHFSWYQLTLEPNTLFYRQPPILPSDNTLIDMQEQGQDFLQTKGFGQYEVSAYAKPGRTCLHNTNYWQFGDYIGIGAGAHGKITKGRNIYRTQKFKHPKRYLEGIEKGFVEVREEIAAQDLMFEFMLNALRLKTPIEFNLFEERTSSDRSVILPILDKARNKGLMTYTEKDFQTTELGWRFLNDVVGMFLV